MIDGKYGFVTIKSGAYAGEIGYYLENVEPDKDGYKRAHVALVDKSKVTITRFTNLEWLENQDELDKKYESVHQNWDSSEEKNENQN